MGTCDCLKDKSKKNYEDKNETNENEGDDKLAHNSISKDNLNKEKTVNHVIIKQYNKEEKNNNEKPKTSDFLEINRYLTQICKSICKLQIDLGNNNYKNGTGFLLKFRIEN